MSDRRNELAEQLRNKNSEVLSEYLTEVRRPLIAFIVKRLGEALRQKVEPDDIFQDVRVDAFRSFDKIEFGDRDPFSWLCQIAERRIIDADRHFKAQKRASGKERALESGAGDSGGLIDVLAARITTPSAAFSRNVREMRLHEALEQLPEIQREALRMRYVENLPSKEIAEKIGKSDAAVRVMLIRSLKKLESIMS